MKKFNTKRIVSLILALVMLMSMVSLNVFAEESAPTVDVKAKNLWYGETYYPMFAIDAQNVPAGGTVDVAITKNGEAIGAVRLADDAAVIDEVSYPAFRAAEGVPAADIDTLYTVQALIKDASGNVVASSDTYTYSILQYVYEMLYIVPEDQKADEKDLCTKFLAFAQASEKLNAKTTELTDTVYVNCVNTVAESGTGTGLYAKGNVKFTTDLVADAGYVIVYKVTDLATKNVTNVAAEDMAADGIEINTNICVAAELEEDVSTKVVELLATFNLGENGAAGHKDGGSDKATYSETADGYTLSITGGSKMYPSSYDEQGNSCIKFGSSSAAGKMTITVPDNITKVELHIAKYKDKTAKVTINGTTQTLTLNSNDGQYDVIEIDTTSNKTITFTTASGGYRAMLNTIVYYGYAE